MSIKLVIFDLDGVLIDSRNIHFASLNDALISLGYKPISIEEHLSTFDGLSTTKKLQMLTKSHGVKETDYQKIWELKQEFTVHWYEKSLNINQKVIDFIHNTKKINSKMKFAVASNSISSTMRMALYKIGILHLIDLHVSNEDVKTPKPFPEMYWKIMSHFKINPKETLILEDSHIGRMAAIDSGANLFPVENSDKIDYNAVLMEIEKMNNNNAPRVSVPWIDERLNVLIPMAGAGTRFANAGYTFPKPLIEVRGKPMIQVVVENLNIKANYIFLVQREHYEKYNMKYLLNLIAPNCKVVLLDGVTEGAACTTLLAKEYINNTNPLLICNSDQFIEWDSNACMYAFSNENINGGILTFNATHPKWSFVKLDKNGFVSVVAEKQVISDIATVGIYYWKRGLDYVYCAEEMIKRDIRYNNEFYICPVYNQAIEHGAQIRTKNVDKMWGLGTPEDLNRFLSEYKGNV